MLNAVGLILNRQNRNAVQCAEKAAAFLETQQIMTFDPQVQHPLRKPDLIVTFGGDGTFLVGARYAMNWDVPLLGVNLGTVGFLTEEEPAHVEDALKRIIRSECQMEERSLLHVVSEKNGKEWFALNDAVITRGGYARLIRVDAFVNGREYGVFTADGIITATPTGSTGYSLSAGGPIVEPEMNCMVITPVCAHSMQHCPCVVSGTSEIRLLLSPDRVQTAELQIDGQNMSTLQAGDEILIKGSDRKIRLIRLHPYDFFGLVRRKLVEWGS